MTIDHIYLRAPEPEDVDRLFLWENDSEDGLHGHWARAPLSRFQIWEYVNSYDANPTTQDGLRLMVVCGGETVGTVDLYDIDLYNRHASIGIYISRQWRGKGIGKLTIESVETYASGKLGLHSLSAYCIGDNVVSHRLFEVAGFEIAGRLKENVRIGKRYHDMDIFNEIL